MSKTTPANRSAVSVVILNAAGVWGVQVTSPHGTTYASFPSRHLAFVFAVTFLLDEFEASQPADLDAPVGILGIPHPTTGNA